MALILNLETATKTCSVALSKDGTVIGKKELTSENYSHAEKLNLFIEDVLAEANVSLKELDALAVSAGPGSYTGLRIGTSTAKGLCYALDKPLIAVNSLKALTAQLKQEKEMFYAPMFDARRMEVYTALYDDQLNEIKATDAVVMDSEFCNEIEGKVVYFGPGASKCKELLSPEKFTYTEVEVSAVGMAQLADEQFNQNNFVDVAYFEPAYLKDFVAGKPKKLL